MPVFQPLQGLYPLLRRIFGLLKKTQPIAGEYDVAWWGPYYIPRSRLWHPSRFTLYNGSLYPGLDIPPHSLGLAWNLTDGKLEFDRGLGHSGSLVDEYEWGKALVQIEHRLESALRDFPRYNRFVQKHLPPSCRTGKIRRGLTWPTRMRSVLPLVKIKRLETALAEAGRRPPLEHMTAVRYLETAGIAYDAAFKELRRLPPRDKYRKKADGRHGGLLDLPESDPVAFSDWFHSHSWAGSHPWEIVFGHPHGIMISPRFREDKSGWDYLLWVDSMGWYSTAAGMASAMAEAGIPFELLESKPVLDALQGLDDVEVGPGLYQVHYEDLAQERPESLPSIRWDPIPTLGPITPDQAARVAKAEMEN